MKKFNLSILMGLLVSVTQTFPLTQQPPEADMQESCYLCTLECQKEEEDCKDREQDISKKKKSTAKKKEQECVNKREEVISPLNLQFLATLVFCAAVYFYSEAKIIEPIKSQKAIEGQPESFLVKNKNAVAALVAVVLGEFIKSPLVDQVKLLRSWTNMNIIHPARDLFFSTFSA